MPVSATLANQTLLIGKHCWLSKSLFIIISIIIIVWLYHFLIYLTGDVHVGVVDRGGQLEVEVNQARGLTPKPGSKNIPGTLNLQYCIKATYCPASVPV